MKRRDFLFTSAAGLTWGALFPSLLSGCSAGKDPLHDFGLITNVVKDLMQEDHRATMSMLADMGYKYLDKVKFAVDECNRMGEICNENGLRFAYHNHDQEFQTDKGVVLYDYILGQTVPDLVTMEIDLYWSYKGGADIRAYFKKYPGRFELVHVKDSYDSPDRESFAPVGDGIIDFTDLLSYHEVGGFKHLIVENDQPGPNQEAVARTSIEHLQSLKF